MRRITRGVSRGRGTASRARHPVDRRVRVVSATDEGRRAAARAEEILGRPPEPLRALATTDLAALGRVLDRPSVAAAEPSAATDGLHAFPG